MVTQQQRNMMAAAAENQRRQKEAYQRQEMDRLAILAGICLSCSGSGRRWLFSTCRKCAGTGRVAYCQACNGRGKGWIFTCKYCHGNGRIQGTAATESSPTESSPIESSPTDAATTTTTTTTIYPGESSETLEYTKTSPLPNNHLSAQKKPPFASIVFISGILTITATISRIFRPEDLMVLIIISVPLGACLGWIFGSGIRSFLSGLIAWLIGGLFAFFVLASLGLEGHFSLSWLGLP